MMAAANDSLIEDLQKLFEQQDDIRLSIVFGSIADGTWNSESDLDIAVLAGGPLTPGREMALIDALARVAERPIDLIDLSRAGEPLLGQILQHGRRLTGADSTWATLVTRHLFDSADFLPYRNRMLRERREAWINPGKQ